MELGEILATLTTDDGLAFALIVGRDGLLVEGQSRANSTDLEAIAVMATRALLEAERLGRVVAGGTISQMRLRLDSYLLLIETLTSTDVLVAGMQGAGNSERFLDAIAHHRPQLQQMLSGL
jgi:predicted regulator of Ras-like GTPase activity (Roadblock/LC7/MglB family)